jgi:geranylgeranyl pyrophosphate synthase
MTEPAPSIASRDEITSLRARIDERLGHLVPDESTPPEKLHRAIRYSLLAPGKRVRPIVTLFSAEAFGARNPDVSLDPACAVEMVHAASLIVDDLPFMDDADERRGRASSHRAFGVQTATLASLALLNRSFGVLAGATSIDERIRTELVRILSRALGDTGGAIAGQEEDIESPGEDFSLRELERMVRHKTSALFVASAEIGARIAEARSEVVAAARDFGRNFGLCFQVLDDLADRPTADGTAGDRTDQNKATFVNVLGVDRAWRAAEEYAESAVAALDDVDLADSSLARLTRAMMESRRRDVPNDASAER